MPARPLIFAQRTIHACSILTPHARPNRSLGGGWRASAAARLRGGPIMYKNILIATDGSELAGKAVAAGFDLARQREAQVSVVTVAEPWTAVAASGEAALAFPVA